MPLCTITETAKICGYKSRSQIYRMLNDGWLNDYLVEIEGTKYLDLKPAKKPHLAEHMAGIAQWRPNGVLHNRKLTTG